MSGPESAPGPVYRVYCPTCDVETEVASRIVAMDMVDGHHEDRDCDDADWEAVGDD